MWKSDREDVLRQNVKEIMNNYLASNIRFLRKSKEMTQDALALEVEVNRSMIGAYEEGRAVPRIGVLQAFSVFFRVTLDQLINQDLSLGLPTGVDSGGTGLRVIATVVDRDERELITIVPVKASAGYMNGYGDREYVGQLPRFSLPLPELSGERTRRVFQIRGDSMLPIRPGAYVLCDYLQDWTQIRDGETYILVTLSEGIVFKRVYSQIDQHQTLLLRSDNPDYQPYSVSVQDVREVWKATGVISFDLDKPEAVVGPGRENFAVERFKRNEPHPDQPEEITGLYQLAAIVLEMRKELDALKQRN